ncbi:MAG: phosphoglycerate kinase [Chlorobi bacterium]|nr:phosphoglycerate kinase [Chlorobiota bacterium]
MKKLTVRDIDVEGRKVLVRVDFNVPIKDGIITDDTRVRASLPTISYLLEHGAAVILMSHLGRPKGKVVPEMSLEPVARRLEELLGCPVVMADDCVGSAVEEKAAALQPGDVLLLENLRFHAGEEKNDPGFAEKLAALGDVYVNDAFGTAHRAHASTEGVTRFMSVSVAGFLMEKEIDYLSRAIADPERPYTAILGGAKISGKIDVIQHLLDKVDTMLVGGGMMFTFLKARGYGVGASLVEEDRLDMARSILERVEREAINFVLPVDTIAAEAFSETAKSVTVPIEAIPAGWIGLDIGPETIELFRVEIAKSKTIVWNGPMGVFEMEPFAAGTRAVAEALAEATRNGATTIVGGGDSAAAITKLGLQNAVSHVSTGGGASLEFLEGKTLPGVAALTDKPA